MRRWEYQAEESSGDCCMVASSTPLGSTEAGSGQAIRAVRKRLEQCAGNSNRSTILTLTVLETCAKNCR